MMMMMMKIATVTTMEKMKMKTAIVAVDFELHDNKGIYIVIS